MAKPILYSTASYAFDAAYAHDFMFRYTGSQAVSNTLTIRNNETNDVVYKGTSTTMQLRHTVPAGTLTNGTLYSATVYVTDATGVNSSDSEPVLFYCYTTPTFHINIVTNQIIEAASYQVEISYEQSEGEQLQSYQVSLYDLNKQLIYSSSTRYDYSVPVNIGNLEDNTSYYIRATGETINHMSLDTDYILFSVDYILPSMYSYIVVENIADEGYMKIISNVLSIEGMTLDGSEPLYINDDYIDTINGSKITFNHGYKILDNFFLRIIIRPCGINVSPLILSNGKKNIVITERRGNFYGCDGYKMRYELRIDDYSETYLIDSNSIDIPSDDAFITLYIKKNDDLYDINIILLDDETLVSDGSESEAA